MLAEKISGNSTWKYHYQQQSKVFQIEIKETTDYSELSPKQKMQSKTPLFDCSPCHCK